MRRWLAPDYYTESVLLLEPSFLRQLADVVVLDLDNTLVPRDVERIDPQHGAWVQSLLDAGLDVVIVSNNWRGRVEKALEGLDGLRILAPAGKPLLKNLKKALSEGGHRVERAILIGDQVFTDIMGARRLGLTTILVKPLSGYDLPHTRVLRLIEKRLLSQWLASGRSVHLGAR